MDETDSQVIEQETPADDVFIAPSINKNFLLAGTSYTHHSAIPEIVAKNTSTECVLGVDEAGRGPVLDLYQTCGWAARVMSARDISSGMLKPAGTYNLNAQAMDATIELIKDVFAKGINVKEIYIDTIGSPQVYQNKLERIFPTTKITVAKKADSLYPCVSAASVCAKVTRDAALEVCYQTYGSLDVDPKNSKLSTNGWGSGYPSDARCSAWLKENMNPLFGWGNECRFSWKTSEELLETKGVGVKIDWPLADEGDQITRVTDFFRAEQDGSSDQAAMELANWFGKPATEDVFS